VITRIILIIALCAAAVTGCSENGGSEASSDSTRVVAGFYPLAFAAEKVGGASVEVTNLTPAGAEPHDLELTPRELETILGADLVIYLGAGFQPAVEEAVEGTDVAAIDALKELDLEDGEEAVDPHVWLDPVRFAEIVERIGTALGRDVNARRLAVRLRGLDEKLREGLRDCDRRELVTAHDAFGYFADRYRLEVIPITGLAPEAEPSPQDLEAIARLVRDRGVTTVFTETLLSPELGETVAREAGATTAVLNPLEGLTEEEIARGEDYFSVMEANLAELRDGLGCR
jgi:zinc transport system substrate-binding protein